MRSSTSLSIVLASAAAVLAAVNQPAAAQDSPRCIPLRNEWNAGLNRSVDVAALMALRARLTNQGLSLACMNLLTEIDERRASIGAQAAGVTEGATPLSASEIEAGMFAEADSCSEMKGYADRYPRGRFIRQAQVYLDQPNCSAAGASAPPASAPVLATGARPAPFQAFRDCADCLEMVALPGGTFVMGSPPEELARGEDEDQAAVTLRPFAVSRFPVTRGEYAAFVAATGRATAGNCWTDRAERGVWAVDPQGTWIDPAIPQTDRHPVVCVSWSDAQAFADWMRARTGEDYRMISEAEYEYAARGGRASAYFWGDDAETGCAYANGADAALKRALPKARTVACDDGHERTAPVGALTPNPFGLFDMTGNVWSWTADCYANANAANPRDGRPNLTADCAFRVLRGGSWLNRPQNLRAAFRGRLDPASPGNNRGFRLARGLSP